MITFLLRVWRSFWGFLPAQLVERTRHDKEGEKTKGRTTATASKDLAHGPPSLGIWPREATAPPRARMAMSAPCFFLLFQASSSSPSWLDRRVPDRYPQADRES